MGEIEDERREKRKAPSDWREGRTEKRREERRGEN